MSNKQINKMLSLKGVFYGLKACIYGILSSLIILAIMYYNIEDYSNYKFKIPLIDITICIIIVYSIIFFSIWYAKRNIRANNIF